MLLKNFFLFALSSAYDGRAIFEPITSSNDVTWASNGLSTNDFELKMHELNPVIARFSDSILLNVDTDAMVIPEFGITLHPEIFEISIKMGHSFSSSSSDSKMYYNFNMEIKLTEGAPDAARDFNADLEIIYLTEFALKSAFSDQLNLPEGTIKKWAYVGRTDVDVHGQDEEMSGECFRTEASPGYCYCRNNNVIDWEGKCVKASNIEYSCEESYDTGTNPNEDGKMDCGEGYEIRIESTYWSRSDTTTCSAGNDGSNSANKKYQECICAGGNHCPSGNWWSKDSVKAICDGKQTCEYQVSDGVSHPNGEKEIMKICKGLRRFLKILYACSKLKEIEPTTTPGEPVCGGCEKTGYTRESDCEFTGLNFNSNQHLADEVASYEDCLAQCDAHALCHAFIYIHRTRTANCFMKTGLSGKSCTGKHAGLDFTFGRKCEFHPECATIEKCSVASIPFNVFGKFEWDCSTAGTLKTCNMICPDGYAMAVQATCDSTQEHEWILNEGESILTGMYTPGCKTCQADPNVVYPLVGGSWNCNTITATKGKNKGDVTKECKASCQTKTNVLGVLECLRSSNGNTNAYDYTSDDYNPDKKMTNFDRKSTHGISCIYDVCDLAQLDDLLSVNYPSIGSFAEHKVLKNTGEALFQVAAPCDSDASKFKRKCVCRAKKGKRKFKCVDRC